MHWIKKLEAQQTKITLLVLLLVFTLGVYRLASESKPYPTGDAIEYTIMTEAFYNHMSPDVRSADFESFKKAYTQKQDWGQNDKASVYDGAQKFVEQNDLKPLEFNYAFFVDEDGDKYSCHFFVYSLLNVPVRAICSVFEFNPLLIHQITNLVLVLITCFFLFKYSPFSLLYTSVAVLMFYFSSIYWYLSWQHPEVYTVCFSSLGLWLFLSERRYAGLLLISLAALQNQPISVLVGFLSIYTFFMEEKSIKNILKLGFSTFWILIPSLFYYYHFGETNLIKYQGALSFDYVSFSRVFGLYFDINQGAILAIPFVIFAYIVLLIRKPFHFEMKDYSLDYIIVISSIISVCIAGTIDNWNHGQSVVNRYATYFSGIILIHFVFLLHDARTSKYKKIVLALSLATQIATVLYHNSLSQFDWSTNLPKPISNWVLDHFPSFYNPDPIIFKSRYNPTAGKDPVYYMKKNGEITKFMVHEKNVEGLGVFGISTQQIDSIREQLSFVNDWAYINVDDKLKSFLSVQKLKEIDNSRKIADQITIIKATPDWFENIKNQALRENISIEDCLEKNARYVLNIHDGEIKLNSKEDRINAKIAEINANSAWVDLIRQKANEQKISLDSAIYLDAKWMVEEELNKK